jgi:hypothetical protein
MIEVKTPNTIKGYIGENVKKEKRQLFSYLYQDKLVEIGSYYTFDLETNKNIFYSIIIQDKNNNYLAKATSVDDLYER